jgi:cell division protein FtsW (lipid II flippase)
MIRYIRRFIRLDEVLLLILVFVLFAVGYIQLVLSTDSAGLMPTARGILQILWPSSLPLLCFIAMSILLHRFQPKTDQLLLPLTAFLSGMGLLFTSRLAPSLAVLYPDTYPDVDSRQAMWITLGLIVFGLIVLVPWDDVLLKRTRMSLIDHMAHYRYAWLSIGMLLIVATLFFGTDPNQSGVRAWLTVGPITFQPSELLKIVLVIFLASYLDEHQHQLVSGTEWFGVKLPSLTAMLPLLLMWGIAMALIVIQRDLGAALMLFSVFLAMIYVATGRGLYAGGGLLAFLVGAYTLHHFLPIVQLRVALWLDPWLQERGYQSIQGMYALASGGILGSGMGRGMPAIVPASHTDYIFTSIGEELGLLGAVSVLLVYLLFAVRGYSIAMRLTGTYSTFEQLLVVGFTTILVIQAFIIIGGNLRLIPLTGITMPFVSYGGSAVLMNFVVMGLLARLSVNQKSLHSTIAYTAK